MSRPSFGELGGEDPYTILGVSPAAGPEEIRAARRRLLRVFHPDLPTGDLQRTQMITAAADILLDPLRLAGYQDMVADRDAERAARRAAAEAQARAAAVSALRRASAGRAVRRGGGRPRSSGSAGATRTTAGPRRAAPQPRRTAYVRGPAGEPVPGRHYPGGVTTTGPAGGPHVSRPRRARGPRHAAAPRAGTAAAAGTWSLLAVIAAVASVTCTPFGLPLGVAALRRVERTGQRGRGLALFGIAAGTLLLGGYLLLLAQAY